MSLLAQLQTHAEQLKKGYRNNLDSKIASSREAIRHLTAERQDHLNKVTAFDKRLGELDGELRDYEALLSTYDQEVEQINVWLGNQTPQTKIEFQNVGDKTVGEILHWLITDGVNTKGFYVSNVVCSKSTTQVARVLKVLTSAKILQPIHGTKAYAVVEASKSDLELLAKEYPYQLHIPVVKKSNGSSVYDLTGANEKTDQILAWRTHCDSEGPCSLVSSITGLYLFSSMGDRPSSFLECAQVLTALDLWDYLDSAIGKNGWTPQIIDIVHSYR